MVITRVGEIFLPQVALTVVGVGGVIGVGGVVGVGGDLMKVGSGICVGSRRLSADGNNDEDDRHVRDDAGHSDHLRSGRR